MTEFLLKRFTKADSNAMNPKTRESIGTLAGIVGIACNLILFAIKLFIGLFINSIAIIADSINNLSDSGSAVVTLIGFRIGASPADEEHPFGHGRMEYISALIVSFIILLLGYEFFKSSVDKILHPELVKVNPFLVIILFLAIFVKLWLSRFYRKIGNKINSGVLIASAIDSRNDIVVTSITLISIIFTYFSGIVIDGYAGVAVSIFILYSGFSIAKEMLQPLLGESVSFELSENIKQAVLSHYGIIGVHDLIVHNYGPNMSIATIHAEISDANELHSAHELIDFIEQDVSEKLNIMLTIHMDPINIDDERLPLIKAAINHGINSAANVSAHDLRIIDQISVTNVVFELSVPHKSSEEFTKKLINDINREVKNLNDTYVCLITIENGYIGASK